MTPGGRITIYSMSNERSLHNIKIWQYSWVMLWKIQCRYNIIQVLVPVSSETDCDIMEKHNKDASLWQ